MNTQAQDTVQSLLEALPHVQAWHGKTVVVKIGGAAMEKRELVDAFTTDAVLLVAVGVRVVLVHGGGSSVSAVGKKLGIEPEFIDGLRVTDDKTMRVAQMVQVGGLSRDLLASIGRLGGRGVGLSGQDGGGWLRAKRVTHTRLEDGAEVSLGRVGQITEVHTRLIEGLFDSDIIPVVSPVAVDAEHESLNVNADVVATAVAKALNADKLIYMTDVKGILGPDGELATTVTSELLEGWISEGVIQGGMIPKVRSALDAHSGGVERVTIADGRIPHALLLELLTDAGVGSMLA